MKEYHIYSTAGHSYSPISGCEATGPVCSHLSVSRKPRFAMSFLAAGSLYYALWRRSAATVAGRRDKRRGCCVRVTE